MFKLRSLRSLSVQRLIASLALLVFVPLAHEVDALVSVAVASAVLWVVVAFEARRYADARREVRQAEHARRHPH